MNHVVLLGDSIFDNGAYVGGGPDVASQLRQRLPQGWKATLRAVDGSITRNVRSQLNGLALEDGYLIVSVGGNDALGAAGILQESARSTAEVLLKLADIQDDFQRDYQIMLDAVLARRLPTALCTIYYPRFPDSQLQRTAVTALTVFNDCITREAFSRGLPLIDLRLVCNEDSDYANPIEPSVQGGEKIASAIATLVAGHDFNRRRTEVFVK
jgi:hypothetical protein